MLIRAYVRTSQHRDILSFRSVSCYLLQMENDFTYCIDGNTNTSYLQSDI